MKIVLTGSLGHISEPLATTLPAQNHEVRVLTSNKKVEIEQMGASAAIGNLKDPVCLTVRTPIFAGSYEKILAYTTSIAQNYVTAMRRTAVSKAVMLSIPGAHMPSGNGLPEYGYHIEQIYQQLTVTEIAYGLGFEHAQPIDKLVITKTKHCPLQFRARFN